MFHHLSYRALVYGTENEDKVREAITNLIPSAQPEKEVTEGYYKNPLTVLHQKINKKSELKNFILKINQITSSDRKQLLRELEDRMDEKGNLFLRFDKQRAYLGDLKLVKHGDAIHIRIKIAAYPARKKNALKVAKQIFGEEDVH
jgi:RNA binding exosome subunit